MIFLAEAQQFDGFHGLSYALLVAGFVALAMWLIAFGYRWMRTRPDLPSAGPEISEIPDDPQSPAVVNFLVNNWNVTPSGISATMVDLSARRILGLDLVGHDGTVVRLRDTPSSGTLAPYEEQVYKLVQSRATGGSAPIEAIVLDEGSAEGWIKRFKNAVVAEARDKGLARKRWEFIDYVIVGVGLAFVFGFFALAFGQAHVGESNSNGDGMSPGDWLAAGGFAWLLAMGLVTRSQDVTDTPEGKRVCAEWLGMRNYFRNSHAFDDQPPASVAIWDRLLSYGVATGAAHDAAAGLPIAAEDEHTAWTRSTGVWRELRIEYPERFGFGQRPLKVFAEGLVRTLFWGALAYVMLPVVAVIVYQVGRDILNENATATNGLDTNGLRLLVATIVGMTLLMGAYLSARTFGGVARLVRGAMDLGKTRTLEGEVVKVHRGRFAVDDGKRNSAVALFRPPTGPTVTRGDMVRAVVSPHLWHVSSLSLLNRAAGEPAAAAAAVAASSPARAAATAAFQGLTPDALLAATGLPWRPASPSDDVRGWDNSPAMASQRFEDGNGNHLTVALLSSMATTSPLFSVITKLATRIGEPVEGIGDSAIWTRERALVVSADQQVFVVDIDSPKEAQATRLETARKVAGLLVGTR
ncbi:MAG: hypothetical protein AB7J35_11135 [Dehalococcoidia bacterium]